MKLKMDKMDDFKKYHIEVRRLIENAGIGLGLLDQRYIEVCCRLDHKKGKPASESAEWLISQILIPVK